MDRVEPGVSAGEIREPDDTNVVVLRLRWGSNRRLPAAVSVISTSALVRGVATRQQANHAAARAGKPLQVNFLRPAGVRAFTHRCGRRPTG